MPPLSWGRIVRDLSNAYKVVNIYHDKRVTVKRGTIELSKLKYWRKNARTLLNLEAIQKETGKSINDLSDDDLLDYMVKDPDLKLRDLARSIEKNGVRVPITLNSEGHLVDGNRRLFACKILVRDYNKEGKTPPGHVLKITADVLPSGPEAEEIEKLAIAEANFVDDYRVGWPREVKARVIEREYREAKKRLRSESAAYNYIERTYGLDWQEISTFLNIVKFTNEFVHSVEPKMMLEAKAIAKDRWNSFEDFISKTRRGRYAIKEEAKFEKLKETFFNYIFRDVITSMTNVRELVLCFRDPESWKMVRESAGLRLKEAAAIAKANLELRSYGERVKHFSRWLAGLSKSELKEIGVEPLEKLISRIKLTINKLAKR